MREYTAESDCGANQGIEFFVATNGELQMTWRNALDLKILGRVAGKFKDFRCEILEDRCDIYGSW